MLNETHYPKRKKQRLRGYDYSQNGAYFVTMCTHGKRHFFGVIQNGRMSLNNAGEMVKAHLGYIDIYADVAVEKYVIMPNHVHAIIMIQNTENTASGATQEPRPTISGLIQRFKSITTNKYIECVKSGEFEPFNKAIWQKSFYDHIIRDENQYLQIWKYIDENPLKWELDEYYRQGTGY